MTKASTASAGSSTTSSSDVLVIGAGPAGSAAAIVLARAGLDVTVLDRARFPRDKVCGDAVSSGAVALLDELGAGASVRAGAHALLRRGVARFPDGSSVERHYADPGFIVPRLTLDDAVRRAAEAAGARVLEGVRARSLLVEGERVVGARGEGFSHSARVVIAADGYGSIAWAHVGADAKRGRALAISTTGYFRGIRFPEGTTTADHYFEHDLPFGYGWVFPEVDGVANAGVYLRKDGYQRAHAALHELMARFIARHPERFAGAERVGPLRTWSLPLAPARWPAAAPGLLLAGDAGGFVDPLSGEGIWQALFTGVTAGRVAAEAVRGVEGLTPALRRRFAQACDARIVRSSRGKLVTQELLQRFLDARLYRVPPLRAALRIAYARRAFEMTKA